MNTEIATPAKIATPAIIHVCQMYQHFFLDTIFAIAYRTASRVCRLLCRSFRRPKIKLHKTRLH